MEALKRANDIRTARAKLKKDLESQPRQYPDDPAGSPEYVLTAKVFDMLLAVPKYGRVKTNRILNQCRILAVEDDRRALPAPAHELVGLLRR